MAITKEITFDKWIDYLSVEDEEADAPELDPNDKIMRDQIIAWSLSDPAAPPPSPEVKSLKRALETAKPNAEKVRISLLQLQSAYNQTKEPNLLAAIAHIAFTVGYTIRAIVACNQAFINAKETDLLNLVHKAIFIGMPPNTPLEEFIKKNNEIFNKESRQLKWELEVFYGRAPII